jgi:GPH family glycoside/pentoside/hexuronide:cation symporter
LVFFIDGYLALGSAIAEMFLIGFLLAAFSAPLWLYLIKQTNKSFAWAVAVTLFILQLWGMSFTHPGGSPWLPLVLVVIANICLAGHDTAALAILGDIADFGRLRFRRERSGIYFALNALVLKFGLGIGGGVAIGLVGLAGFDPRSTTHDEVQILVLKLVFSCIPTLFAVGGLLFIRKAPLNRKRCLTIQHRLEGRT